LAESTVPVKTLVCGAPALVPVIPAKPETKLSAFAVAIVNATVPVIASALPELTAPPKYNLWGPPAVVTVHEVPLLQVAVIVEVVVVVADWLKVPNPIAVADMEHVPVTVPELAIVALAVRAKVLLAVDKSNTELISNNFFILFIFSYIGCLRNIN